MKHTPGPWEAEKGAGWIVRRPHAEARREAAIMVGMSPAVSLVCDPQAKWFEDGEAEANARLIAAAPELLDALKQLSNSACDGRDIPEWLREHLPAIHAAIAKAEGEPR